MTSISVQYGKLLEAEKERARARAGTSMTKTKNLSEKLQPSTASVDNCLLGLHNSSYHAQPHPILGNYFFAY